MTRGETNRDAGLGDNQVRTDNSARPKLDIAAALPVSARHEIGAPDRRVLFASARRAGAGRTARDTTMKIKNSLKSLKTRDRNNRIVRRKGRVYVINKQNPRYKARQG